MPIKGKKKPQSRGSQARRRPAAAPRPAMSSSRRAAWYRSPGGRGLIVIVVLVALGLGAWGIGSARSNAREADARRTALEDYSGKLRTLLQSLAEPVAAMSAAPTAADGTGWDLLEDAAKGWAKVLRQAQGQTDTLFPPAGLEGANTLFGEAILVYAEAARTYALGPAAEKSLADKLLARAAELRDRATSIWQGAVEVLDTARRDADLDPSGLQSPTELAPPPQPTPIPTSAPSPTEEDGGEPAGGRTASPRGKRNRKGSGND